MPPKHFLDIDALDSKTLRAILDQAAAIKRKRIKGKPPKGMGVGEGAVLAMIFEKPSTRTRVSFEVAMHELGGSSIVLIRRTCSSAGARPSPIPPACCRAMSMRSCCAPDRTRSLLELAAHATVPVINGLTCRSHPCQVMADVMTFEEMKGPIKGRTVAWLGDANNVAASWVHAAARFGFKLKHRPPEGIRAFAGAARLGQRRRREDRGGRRSASGGAAAPIAW